MSHLITLEFRWETEHRYYTVIIRQDMFSQWQCVRTWGERAATKGQQSIDLVGSYEEAEQRLRRIAKERARFGYTLTTPPVVLEAYGLEDLMEVVTV